MESPHILLAIGGTLNWIGLAHRVQWNRDKFIARPLRYTPMNAMQEFLPSVGSGNEIGVRNHLQAGISDAPVMQVIRGGMVD